MLYLKSCPKCKGDMYLDRDHYGSFRQCLQCGRIQDLVEMPTLAQAALAAKKSMKKKEAETVAA